MANHVAFTVIEDGEPMAAKVWLAPGGAADDVPVTEDGKFPQPGDALVTYVTGDHILTFTVEGALDGDSIIDTVSPTGKAEQVFIEAAAKYLKEIADYSDE
jgi:hypothetical protein